MKKLVVLPALFVAFVAIAQKNDTEEVEIFTSAICEMCKETIEYDLTFAKGIKDVNLNLENKIVTVAFKPGKTTAKDIRERITKLGYHADSLRRDPVAYENLPFCCKDGGHDGDHRN